MNKETNIDSMKYRKSTHLAGVDVETIVNDAGKCVLTIKEAWYEQKVDVSGNKTDGYFISFVQDQKDMVVNSSNRKAIASMVKAMTGCSNIESRNIGNWAGVEISLYFDPSIKFGLKVVGGIRILKDFKPVLVINDENYNKCKTALDSGNFTIDQIKKKYTVTKAVETEITKTK
jgi:hypothetical protein